jgi:hypothetical protein
MRCSLPDAVSTVPAVLDRLVELARSVMDEAVQVDDGQPVRDTTDDILVVGFTGDPDEDAVTDTRTREQMTVDPETERYEISCVASSWKGVEGAIQPVRARAYELVDAFNAEILRDHTLGGLVMSTRIATVGLQQGQTDGGAVATVRFVVAVMADTT